MPGNLQFGSIATGGGNWSHRNSKFSLEFLVMTIESPLAARLVGELWNAKVKAEMIHKKVATKHIGRARDSRIPWVENGQVNRDMTAPIIEIIVISIEPNDPKTAEEKSVPSNPTVDGFTFKLLPSSFPVSYKPTTIVDQIWVNLKWAYWNSLSHK
ncbi:hypothetical protein T459_20101 [Capsicum annuum]|uniref:Uncharacterized protein n=1 Tax=Capsicum annuum TaxID=4072 RepID=A0A2G2Z3M5_CAPAN|nr:hypothetical protein T459_20101 [Capsicum annuum]